MTVLWLYNNAENKKGMPVPKPLSYKLRWNHLIACFGTPKHRELTSAGDFRHRHLSSSTATPLTPLTVKLYLLELDALRRGDDVLDEFEVGNC